MKAIIKAKLRRYGPVFLSLIIASLGSQFITGYILLPSHPQVRPEFPQNLITAIRSLKTGFDRVPDRHPPLLPLPWTLPGYTPFRPTLKPQTQPPTSHPPQPTPSSTIRPTLTPQPTAPPTQTPPPTTKPTLTPTTPPSGVLLSNFEQETVQLINQRRAQLGIGKLNVNALLVAAARRHSQDIYKNNLCQHNGTDGSSPWDRVRDAGYTGQVFGEVIGCGQPNPQAIVSAWWGSPPHQAILTDPNANEIGVGWIPADGGRGAHQTGVVGRK